MLVRFRPSAPRNRPDVRIVTRSSEVSRVEPTSSMVTRSRAREGRGINVVPEVGFRPETETRHEVDKLAEIQDSISAILVRKVWEIVHFRYR